MTSHAQNAETEQRDDLNTFMLPYLEKIKTTLFNPDGFLMRSLGGWLVKTVLTSKKFNLRVEDVGYDCSAYPVYAGRNIVKADYSHDNTVYDFLTRELTGQTRATYESGMGMMAETLSDAFHDFVIETYLEALRKDFPEIIAIFDNQWDDDYSSIFDWDDIYDWLALHDIVDWSIESTFTNLPLSDVLKKYHNDGLSLIQQEKTDHENKRIAEKKQLLHLQALGKITSNHILNFTRDKTFGAHGIGDKQELLAYLETMHPISVGAALRLLTQSDLKVSNTTYEKIMQQYPEPKCA